MTDSTSITSASANEAEQSSEQVQLRPASLDQFVGQQPLRDELSVYLKAAMQRRECLDHCLLYGPPGLGKTTVANIIANEMDALITVTSGPALTKAVDLTAILSSLQPNQVLFIDEIHRLNISLHEYLHTAMEDRKIDIIIGEGPAASSIRLSLAPFTLIGATTRSGLLSGPFRDRFGIRLRLHYYTEEELTTIVYRSAQSLQIQVSSEGAQQIATRSRGTARIANRLLRRLRDFAQIEGSTCIDGDIARKGLDAMQVDNLGLNTLDLDYLQTLAEFYNGGPAGIEAIAATLNEDLGTLEDMVEPYLLQQGLIQRTARGRALTSRASEHIASKSDFGLSS